MTLVERLRRALETGHQGSPILLVGDNRDAVPGDQDIWVPAAVLVAVTDRDDPGVILTQRTENLRKHAGQIAFPGGRIDAEDSGAIEAALREAEEEIALPRSAVTVIGETDPYHTITGFQVTPVIGVIPPDLVLRANDAEAVSYTHLDVYKRQRPSRCSITKNIDPMTSSSSHSAKTFGTGTSVAPNACITRNSRST